MLRVIRVGLLVELEKCWEVGQNKKTLYPIDINQ
jgi:hypothetical protein